MLDRYIVCPLMSRPLLERVAWGGWGITLIAVSIIGILRPQRCITHVYRDAALHWWAGEPLYSEGVHGFLYLPSSAVLFSPFAYLPEGVGGMAWRWLAFALFSWAVWRLARFALPARVWHSALCLMLLAAIPASTINLVRAQSEVIMCALMIHAAVDIGKERWTRAAAFLGLAIAIKPLALVMLLLVAVTFPRMRWRLAIAIGVGLILPFIHPDPAYVLAQYAAAMNKLVVAATPGSGRWNEATALLHQLHLQPSDSVMTAIRLIAAGGTVVAALAATRRLGHQAGVLNVLALAVSYQLLFNPRTEDGSYLNLAVLAGAFAAIAHYVEGQPWVARGLLALCVGLGTHMYGDWIYRPTDLWLKPLLAAVFICVLIHRILQATPAEARRVWPHLPAAPDSALWVPAG